MPIIFKLDNGDVEVHMSQDEAKWLRGVLSCIGGSPKSLGKIITDDFITEFEKAGFYFKEPKVTTDSAIMFEE